jgi:23S rRNA (guanosine2251-2'-O)-methyltransferase
LNKAEQNILWGYYPVLEAVRSGRREIQSIMLARGKSAPRFDLLVGLAQDRGIEIQWVTLDYLNAAIGHRRHQGAAATVSGFALSSIEQILAAAKTARQDPFVVFLDHIADPQNLGAITRTAQCAGVHGVVITKDRSAPLTPAVSKASAGALEHARLAVVVNLVQTLKELKKNGLWVVGADQKAALDLFQADLKGPIALVIGSEAKGLRPLVKEHCDFTVAIPQTGPVGSLNASAAAAVMMYEIYRQRCKGQNN